MNENALHRNATESVSYKDVLLSNPQLKAKPPIGYLQRVNSNAPKSSNPNAPVFFPKGINRNATEYVHKKPRNDPMFDTQKVLDHTTSNIETREGFVNKNDLGSAEYNVLTSGYGAKTEKSGVTIDRLEKRKRKALKDTEVAYPEFNVILNSEFDILTSTSITDPDCWLSYTWEKDNTLLYINHIDCPKKGEKKGRGKRHTLNTIRALWESGKRFNKIKVRPVPGLDPDRPIDPDRPDDSLESLVATYKRWGFGDLIVDDDEDAIQEGTKEHIEETIAASLGGSKKKTKTKTKKRRQRKTKTKRKQSGNKRRQTKKRGKR